MLWGKFKKFVFDGFTPKSGSYPELEEFSLFSYINSGGKNIVWDLQGIQKKFWKKNINIFDFRILNDKFQMRIVFKWGIKTKKGFILTDPFIVGERTSDDCERMMLLALGPRWRVKMDKLINSTLWSTNLDFPFSFNDHNKLPISGLITTLNFCSQV